MRVLIVHPEFENPGGVSNTYAALKSKFTINKEHFIIGKRLNEKGWLQFIFRLVNDFFLFFKAIKSREYDLIHLNPSLNLKGIVREGVLILLAKRYRKKVIVCFQGWNKDFEKKLGSHFLWIFKKIYFKADVFIVQASSFKKTLYMWGFRQPVYLVTTAVDDKLLEDFDIQEGINKRKSNSVCKVLYLARIVKEKGIYETVNALAILQSKYPHIELVVAGDGEDLADLKKYVSKKKISNVTFTGYVRDQEKRKLFENSYIYIFPTYYEEGMPTSVLEAMSFGLPVVALPTGGIVDFLEDGKNGFIQKDNQPSALAVLIENLYLNKELYKKISLNNHRYANERFLASRVAKRLEKIYRSV